MKAFFVNDRLAFGSKVTRRRHVEKLCALGVTHVINLRTRPLRKIRKFRCLWLGFKDNAKPRPMWFYRRALCFYQRAMEHPRAKVFVMCHHGICRSASLTYFFLRASGASPRRAEVKVLGARPRARIARAYRVSSENYLRRVK